MKIALVSFNPIVGDIYNNIKSISNFLDKLIEKKVDIAVFPELAVCGYPPKDLLDKPSFISDNRIAVEYIAPKSKQIKVILGFVDADNNIKGKNLFNAAAYLDEGAVKAVARKCLLPTYDVFDEDRYFLPSERVTAVQIGDKKFGLSICEDIWFDLTPKYKFDPVKKLAGMGIDYLINISSSPYEEGKFQKRLELVKSVAKKTGIPVLYVNQAGANDGVIFDGGAIAADAKGNIIACADRFKEQYLIFDTESVLEPAEIELPDPDCEIIKALSLGLRDYTHKTGFQKVVLGLSGGIDSALTAAIAVLALGSDNVVGVSMPSRFSSEGSKSDAKKLARNLNIELLTIPIEPVFERYLEILNPVFQNKPWDLAEENIQARIRGNILMALSNKHGWLVLSTGNKSELAVGYCTLYGDMCGALAVISDIFKTKVYQLSYAINREKEIIPFESIDKVPSAELRHNQTDQDSLPQYSLLDSILKAYIEQYKGLEEIVNMGYDKETVLKVIQMVDRSEYKRKQAPIGLKVSAKAFGEGRRIPIVQNYIPLDHCKL